MDDLNAVTLELLRMFSGRAFHNSGPDFANALSPYPFHTLSLLRRFSLWVIGIKFAFMSCCEIQERFTGMKCTNL